MFSVFNQALTNIPKLFQNLKKNFNFTEVVSLQNKETEGLYSVSEIICLVIANSSYFLLYLKEKIIEMTFHQPNSQWQMRSSTEHFLGKMVSQVEA